MLKNGLNTSAEICHIGKLSMAFAELSELLANNTETRLSKQTSLMKPHLTAQRLSVVFLWNMLCALSVAAAPAESPGLLPGGDFQKCAESSKGPPGWESDGKVVKDRGNPQNLVMQITGPDEMGFECPLNLPAAVHSLRVSFRILVPLDLKFDPDVEIKGVRLRARLYGKEGSSGVKERIIPPAQEWQQIQFDWDNIGSFRGRLGIEALWHTGSIYFDDVQVFDRSTDTMK
jgi:hypothetical protein